jgi:uncharacterized protein with GYD domain
MPKYISFFSYTGDAVKAMIEKPTDRAAAAKSLVESVGGKLECFYWMHGHHDGFFIADYKDGMSAAAVAAAAGSAGAVGQLESHELFDSAAQGQIMRAAKTALAGYKPPTA